MPFLCSLGRPAINEAYDMLLKSHSKTFGWLHAVPDSVTSYGISGSRVTPLHSHERVLSPSGLCCSTEPGHTANCVLMHREFSSLAPRRSLGSIRGGGAAILTLNAPCAVSQIGPQPPSKLSCVFYIPLPKTSQPEHLGRQAIMLFPRSVAARWTSSFPVSTSISP